jgi:DNA-directed RNA polymerase specialized sigma24 family protein
MAQGTITPRDGMTSNAGREIDEGFDRMAAGLYSLASMLVGEGDDSMVLVEKVIAETDMSVCNDPAAARTASRTALCATALDTLARRGENSLAAPENLEHAATCIDNEDLDAAGVSGEELEQMIAGPDRGRVRVWLESLPAAMRTAFVLRAVAGLTANETAKLLKAHGGPNAGGWSAEAVRELFRQGLCSLASQVLQEANR